MNTPELSSPLRWGAFVSLVLLILLGVAWELWLTPQARGSAFMALKVLPLLLPLRGVFKGNLYTMQWASMLVLLYLMEGVVRVYSDIEPLSAALGGAEAALALVFYLCAILYVRPAKRAARQQAKANKVIGGSA